MLNEWNEKLVFGIAQIRERFTSWRWKRRRRRGMMYMCVAKIEVESQWNRCHWYTKMLSTMSEHSHANLHAHFPFPIKYIHTSSSCVCVCIVSVYFPCLYVYTVEFQQFTAHRIINVIWLLSFLPLFHLFLLSSSSARQKQLLMYTVYYMCLWLFPFPCVFFSLTQISLSLSSILFCRMAAPKMVSTWM